MAGHEIHEHGPGCTHDHVHSHDHGPETHVHHDHAHDHAGHHHHGDEDDTYFLDQLCLVGLSGGFGAVALSMYFWNTAMLSRLLGQQFHPFVLASGIALVVIALVRAVSLWLEARPAAVPAMATTGTGVIDLEQAHHHGDCCGHDHTHGPHGHQHDHSVEDHDHGWAPWRYVVLLVPIIFFLLNLPSKGPEVTAKEVRVDFTREATGYARLVALDPGSYGMLALLPALYGEGEGEVTPIDYKTLEDSAGNPALREGLNGKTIEVRGQYASNPLSDRVFNLVRFRMSCCAADAIRIDVPIITREPLHGIPPASWVKIKGRIEFRQQNNTYKAVVLVANNANVEPCAPDPNQYVQ